MRAVLRPLLRLLLLLLQVALFLRSTSGWIVFVDETVQPPWSYNTSRCIGGDDSPVDPIQLATLNSWSFSITYDHQSVYDQMWLSNLTQPDRQSASSSSTFCSGLFAPPPGITFNSSTADHCNYTLSWTGPFASPAFAILFNSSSLGSGRISPSGSPQPSSKAVDVALIAGVVGGVVIILACIVAVIVYMLCRAIKPPEPTSPTPAPGFLTLSSPSTSVQSAVSSVIPLVCSTGATTTFRTNPTVDDRTMITTAHNYNYTPQSFTYHHTSNPSPSTTTTYTYPDTDDAVEPIEDTSSVVKVWSEPALAEQERE